MNEKNGNLLKVTLSDKPSLVAGSVSIREIVSRLSKEHQQDFGSSLTIKELVVLLLPSMSVSGEDSENALRYWAVPLPLSLRFILTMEKETEEDAVHAAFLRHLGEPVPPSPRKLLLSIERFGRL